MRIGSVAAVMAAVAVMGGCTAPVKILPEGYAGPKAALHDSTYQETGSKGRVFAAVEIDGQRVASAFEATRRASQGRGFSLAMQDASRGTLQPSGSAVWIEERDAKVRVTEPVTDKARP